VLQLFGRLHSALFKVPLALSATREPADQIEEGPTRFLRDGQGSRLKDHFQIFGHPIIGEARET